MTTRVAAYALRTGVVRGCIEFRHNLTSAREQSYGLMVAAALHAVASFRSGQVPGGVPQAASTLVGSLALIVALAGVPGVGGQLAIEREDTTLLRTRALPYGVVGLFSGRLVTVLLDSLVTALLVLGCGWLVVDGMRGLGPVDVPTLLWLVPLGLVATASVGAVVGSVLTRVRVVGGSTMLGVLAVSAVSGIFFPLTQLPEWAQAIGQVFPVYWLGLGLRSAFLPDAAAAAEIGGSWRAAETLGVLGAWAVAGLLVAPVVLRWMARRESGVDLRARQEKALRRIG